MLDNNFIQSIMLRSSSSLSSTDSEEQIKSVIVKIKDIDSIFPEDYYISYIKEDLRLNSDDVGKTTSEILSGIQIKVYSSLGQFSTTPPFQKLKPIVFKAFKLLAFAFQESYENMTDEDKKIYSAEKISASDQVVKLPMTIVIPAFITSEVKRAFMIGFLLYIPFLIIDIIVSSTLMSMGMVMLPPATISLPFKLMLFVLVDGWNLLIQSLIASFR